MPTADQNARRERPILFSAPMILALLREENPKTQTRRNLKNTPPTWTERIRHEHEKSRVFVGHGWQPDAPRNVQRESWRGECPHGTPGDRLRVKEHVWMFCERQPNGTTPTRRPKFRYEPLREAGVFYCADHPSKPTIGVVHPETGNEWAWRKKLARFMPRWASRITLELTDVRVERLQDISEADAIAEGVDPTMPFLWRADEWQNKTPNVARYAGLWETINGAGSWAKNEWVWVETFRRVTL